MARAPLLQLSDISLTFGGVPLLDGVDVIIQPGDRLALVGRNGSGKSTLMKIMAGFVEPDRGSRVLRAGTHVGYLEQHPDMRDYQTLGDFARRGLSAEEAYRVDMAAQGLKFEPQTPVATASGGERRRAALAGLWAQAPELMLLDEPTNHLDIEAIFWLEEQLRASRGAFVVISHDRAFLRNLVHGTLWLDRAVLRRQQRGFEAFERWRDKLWQEEDTARHKLNRKIKAEARWAVEGISARRKRNQGRVRALAKLRDERAQQIRRQGTAAMALAASPPSGRQIIEARNISKSFDGRQIVRDFSIRILRTDRLALVGPNGAGKTTLLKMLTGEMAPDTGEVILGSGLKMVVFDQKREGLFEDRSLWQNLTGDAEIGISGQADQVMVRGQPRHVVSYLKDFLFTEEQARAPVRTLSGGEKSRLLLARLMARESNVLVLDEPTNDLDMETLDLLQEVLGEYDGTVLLVSHDRDFLDRVATLTLAMEGNGNAVIYPGGWSDYQALKAKDEGPVGEEGNAARSGEKKREKPRKEAKEAKSGLSFTERHRLAQLPDLIARLEADIARLGDLLADPDLFARDRARFDKAGAAMAQRQEMLRAAEEEWLDLEERNDAGREKGAR